MDSLKGIVSTIGEARIVALLGGIMIAMAVGRIVLWEGDIGLSEVVATDLLLFLPGAALLYGGYWLPNSDLHRDTHPLVVVRTLAGIGVMLTVVGVLAISTGLNRPVYTPMIGIALGSVGGFGIGLNEARAVSRAHVAEYHRDELRQERDLREKVVETSPVGIVLVDDDGSIRMANEHAARITGLSEERLEGLDHYNDPMFDAKDAAGNPIETGMVQEILRTGDARYGLERQIGRPDGERIWLSMNGAPLRDSSGDRAGVVLAFEDITERKRLEQELKETIERLEDSNERLEQFAHAASHDLQEPLRMVSSYLQLIERRYEDALDEEGQEYLEFAVDGADRMRDMINGLLQYSRVESEGEPLGPVDLEQVLEDVREDLRVTITDSDATITADSLPRVEGDPSQLRLVFLNLVKNAIEYSGDEPPQVDVFAERTAPGWTISVRDEGIGIAPEAQDRVFEVFERAHSRNEHDSSGIGLAVCQRIIERHGGDIWIDSEPGEGTTVSFTLSAVYDHDE